VVIAVLAPIGDLVESMFKRNLDVKDFGTIVRGHGGVLDRFDGFLFVLPGVYYLTLVLEPWTEFVAS
jgi:phosphatidate cytidylyltransferase